MTSLAARRVVLVSSSLSLSNGSRFLQKRQHPCPSLGRDFGGWGKQPFAAPGVVADAGGGRVVKVNGGQLDVVQDAGDDAAHGSDADLVVALQNSCWPSR